MKIRMLTGISGPTINVSPKEKTEAFSDDEAQRLIDSGQAELVDGTPAVVVSIEKPKPAPKPKAAPKPRAPAKAKTAKA